jgi:hypothetical protein
MMAKWLLAAALVGGLTATVSAEQTRPIPQLVKPSVKVELRGRLQVLYPPVAGDVDGRCLPPIQYAMLVDGQRIPLRINGFANKASDLDGMHVIVTGDLSLDTVSVTDMRQPIDDALIPYVRYTVVGALEREVFFSIPRHGDVMVQELWQIRVNGRTFQLDFSAPRVKADAEKLIGHPVVLEGTFKDGRITVQSVRPVYEPKPRQLPIEYVPLADVR